MLLTKTIKPDIHLLVRFTNLHRDNFFNFHLTLRARLLDGMIWYSNPKMK